MSLEIVTQELGLWRDANWTQNMPGVYALVVGVSAYPFLEGGQTAGPDSYGLGQLVTSATTAAKVFDWLRTSFLRENLPVVWCWLLLSPTAKEQEALNKDGLEHYSEPTYDNLRKAIQAWTRSIPKKPPASDASRSFFFFSGHGVQSNRKAVLLPSNYLDTSLGEPDVQNCISVDELMLWMENSPVAEHIALFDACRNEFSPLARNGATAHQVFPTNDSSTPEPRAAVTLSSTSSNAVSYQFEGLPYTFFGQAVLDALGGAAMSRNSSLEFNEFFEYVRRRVNTLLVEKASQALQQSVRRTNHGSSDLIVTEFKPLVPSESSTILRSIKDLKPTWIRQDFDALIEDEVCHRNPDTTEGFSHSELITDILPAGEASPIPPPGPSLISESSIHQALNLRFDDALEVKECISFAALTDGRNGEAHRRFGHEYASASWVDGRAALYAIQDGQPCPEGATILRVKRNEDSSIIQVDLALQPRDGGVLLVFQDLIYVERERLAMKLPTDSMGKVPIRLTLTLGAVGAETFPKLQNIEGRLGPCEWNKDYNYLSNLFRDADLGSLRKAAERADTDLLKGAAQQKLQAETAATAGILLLAEAGNIAKVGDWPRNLMEWFPLIPDGAILWARALRDALTREENSPYGVANPLEEMILALEAAAKRGVPFFAESLEMAHSILRSLQKTHLTIDQRRRLDAVAQWIDRAMAVTVPAGQFLLVPGLPRPEGMAGRAGAFTVVEILDLLRGTN